jgi:hypothetical protein
MLIDVKDRLWLIDLLKERVTLGRTWIRFCEHSQTEPNSTTLGIPEDRRLLFGDFDFPVGLM